MRLTTALILICTAVALGGEPVPDAYVPPEAPTFTGRLRTLYLSSWGRVEAGETKDVVGHHGQVSNVQEDLQLKGGPFLDVQASLYLTDDDRLTARVVYGEIWRRIGIDTQFEFNGEQFYPGEDLRVELSAGVYGGEYSHRFRVADRVSLWTGLGLALHTINVQIRVDEAVADHIDLLNGERIKAIVPYGHLGLEVDLGRGWSWVTDLRGSPAALPILLGEPAEARFLALESAIAWRPVDWFSIELGIDLQWHRMKFKGVALDDTPDINRWRLFFAGPSIALSFRF